MAIRNRTFSGGYRFKDFEGQPQEKLIEMGIPERVIIPLNQDEGSLLVKAGDPVRAGQILARNDDSISSPILSSVSGSVEEIKRITYFKEDIEAAILKSDGGSEWQPLEGCSSDWEKLPVETIEALLYLSGVSALDREGIPTRYRSSILHPEEVEHIIVHSVGSEVYNLAWSVLLEGKGVSNFVEGLKILRKVMCNAHLHLAINKYHTDLIDPISELLGNHAWVDLYSLDPKYPQGFDEVLVPTILGREFPYGYSAAHIGVVVLNIQAVLQAYEAVTIGKPLIERTVALCGPGFEETPHVKVRIGTPLEYVVQGRIKEGEDVRFILNSALTGAKFSDVFLPVDRTCSHIIALPERKRGEFLAFIAPGFKKDSYSHTFLSAFFKFKKRADTNLHGEERPCIFCNFCQEVCPVSIIPHLIYRYAERDLIDESLMDLKIFHCIECNLCSYVCPSKLSVAKYIKEGKEKLVKEGYLPYASSSLSPSAFPWHYEGARLGEGSQGESR